MQAWKVELTPCGQSLGDMNIRGEYFKVTICHEFLFVLRPTPLTLVPRKAKRSYEWRNRRCRVNHRLLKDDLDIKIEFAIRKLWIVTTKRWKSTPWPKSPILSTL